MHNKLFSYFFQTIISILIEEKFYYAFIFSDELTLPPDLSIETESNLNNLFNITTYPPYPYYLYPPNHKNPLALISSRNSFTSDSNSIISDHSQSIYNNLNHIDNKNEMGTSTNLEHAHRKDNFMHMHHSQDNDKLQNQQNHNKPMTGNDVQTFLKIGETFLL